MWFILLSLTSCTPTSVVDKAPQDTAALDSGQDDSGESGESGDPADSGDSGDSGDSADSADSGDSGGSGDSGDSDPTGGSFPAESSVSDALVRVASRLDNTDLGRVLHVGDVDGDGQDDVVAATFMANSRTGGAYAVPGPLTSGGVVEDLGWHLEGALRGTGTGRSMSLGDVDGDGYLDVGLGAPYDPDDNGLYLAAGPVSADVDLAEVPLLRGPYTSYAGHGSDLRGDLDDDGVDDVVVGAYYTGLSRGLTFIAFGPVAEDLNLEDEADVTPVGEASNVYAGRSIRSGPDLDGDGVDDLVIAALGTMSVSGSGGFYVLYGPLSGNIDLGDADGRYAGENTSGNAGLWLDAGDVSGDGLADVVTSGFDSTLAPSGGAAYVVFGPAADEDVLTDADIVVRGDEAEQYGGGVAVGDLDADGVDELLLGAQGDSTEGRSAGALYLFQDPVPGSYVFTDGDAAFYAESEGDNLGAGAAVGDVDGDGVPEIVIGAPYQDDLAATSGAFYVMHAE